MESYSQTSEKIQVGISKMEYFLLSPGVSIFSFAENAWDGDTADSWCSKEAEALSRFVLFERSRGIEVADPARFGEEARKTRMTHNELHETAKFLNAKHGKLLAQMERKQNFDVLSPHLRQPKK